MYDWDMAFKGKKLKNGQSYCIDIDAVISIEI